MRNEKIAHRARGVSQEINVKPCLRNGLCETFIVTLAMRPW